MRAIDYNLPRLIERVVHLEERGNIKSICNWRYNNPVGKAASAFSAFWRSQPLGELALLARLKFTIWFKHQTSDES
jgi:hypothetical protein